MAWHTVAAKWLPTAVAVPVWIVDVATAVPGPATSVPSDPLDSAVATLWPESPIARPMLSTAVTWRTTTAASSGLTAVPGSATPSSDSVPDTSPWSWSRLPPSWNVPSRPCSGSPRPVSPARKACSALRADARVAASIPAIPEPAPFPPLFATPSPKLPTHASWIACAVSCPVTDPVTVWSIPVVVSLPIACAPPVPIATMPPDPPDTPTAPSPCPVAPGSRSISSSCWAWVVDGSGSAPVSAPPPAAFSPLFARANPKFTMMARWTTSRLPLPDALTVTSWNTALVERLPSADAPPVPIDEVPPIVTNVTLLGLPVLLPLTAARAKFNPEFETPTPRFNTAASWAATSLPLSTMLCVTWVVPVLPVAFAPPVLIARRCRAGAGARGLAPDDHRDGRRRAWRGGALGRRDVAARSREPDADVDDDRDLDDDDVPVLGHGRVHLLRDPALIDRAAAARVAAVDARDRPAGHGRGDAAAPRSRRGRGVVAGVGNRGPAGRDGRGLGGLRPGDRRVRGWRRGLGAGRRRMRRHDGQDRRVDVAGGQRRGRIRSGRRDGGRRRGGWGGGRCGRARRRRGVGRGRPTAGWVGCRGGLRGRVLRVRVALRDQKRDEHCRHEDHCSNRVPN